MRIFQRFCSAAIVLPWIEILSALAANSSYTNPMLPGWHSDPSCIYVGEKYNSFFCATSSFLAFPGIPLYTSKDLMNWKLASNVFSRSSQVPWIANATAQQAGIWAATLRYREGTFYLATVFTYHNPWILHGLIFTSTNPYSNTAWSQPLVYKATDIDPDLFWDDDGRAYLTSASINQQTIDLKTGVVGQPYKIWNGTGGSNPEGPHIYKKEGYYYLLIAEGGTELGHMVTIARSRKVSGPYESYTKNPILTNRNTSEYIQTVGHADLFQDGSGNWWGVALGTRSGPEWVNYPMGRETVLFPVRWGKNEWPLLEPVRSKMTGWLRPPTTKQISGMGALLQDPDYTIVTPEGGIPSHFVHWRFPKERAYTLLHRGNNSYLKLEPSRANLTSNAELGMAADQTFIGRRQVDTKFRFEVNIDFSPTVEEEEVGVTVFLTQLQHVDLGIVLLPVAVHNDTVDHKLDLHVRLRYTDRGHGNATVPDPIIQPIPTEWRKGWITLSIDSDEFGYQFGAHSPYSQYRQPPVGYANATILSGGSGPFTGSCYPLP